MEPVKIREVTEYSVADRKAAYEIYRDPQRGNRSIRKTARLMDIPYGTVNYWNRTENWAERVWAEDERTAEIIRRGAQMRMVNELDHLIDELIHISYHGANEDKVRLEAIKYTLGVMSYSPVQKVQQDITQSVTVSKPAGDEAEKLTARTSDDLAKLVNEKIQALMSGGSVEPEQKESGRAEGEDPAEGGRSDED